jgi:hypothetical protein
MTEKFEATALPNSRQMLPGDGVEFDDSIPNIRTISAVGGGASGGIHIFLLMGG